MDDEYGDVPDTPEPSRRDLIRKGVIALGLGVWTVPLVQRARRQGEGPPAPDEEAEPEVVGFRVVTGPCPMACADVCDPSIVICGFSGALDCVCVPQTYPPGCGCFTALICEDAILCTSGCPPDHTCAQGCCPEPVCLPPCPPDGAIIPFGAADETADKAEARLTFSGKYA